MKPAKRYTPASLELKIQVGFPDIDERDEKNLINRIGNTQTSPSFLRGADSVRAAEHVPDSASSRAVPPPPPPPR